MPPKRPRCCNWVHPEGNDKGIVVLAGILATFMVALCQAGPDQVYTSTSMSSGVDTPKLQDWAELIKALLALDSRGGYFGQLLVVAALNHLLGMPEHAAAKNHLNTVDNLSKYGDFDSVVEVLGYKIRVMLAHARMKFDAQHELTGPLAVALENMGESSSESKRRRKRADRIGDRPHPFIHFRPDTADLDIDEEDAATRVATWYDGKLGCCLMLFDDGTEKFADVYEESPSGFVVAKWLDANGVHTMETEMPNSCLQNGKLVLYTPPAPKAKSKPAAEKKKKDSP